MRGYIANLLRRLVVVAVLVYRYAIAFWGTRVGSTVGVLALLKFAFKHVHCALLTVPLSGIVVILLIVHTFSNLNLK